MIDLELLRDSAKYYVGYSIKLLALAAADEIERLRAEIASLRAVANKLALECSNHMMDYQCAVKCDGPHEDCICWYCSMSKAVCEVRDTLNQTPAPAGKEK